MGQLSEEIESVVQQYEANDTFHYQTSSKTYTKHLITRKDQLQVLLTHLDEATIFAYDTETNGQFDRFRVALVGISFSTGDYTCYIPLAHHSGTQLDINFVLDAVKPYLENPDQEKVCHNVKFDEMVLGRYGIKPRGKGHDTVVMAWMLQEEVRKLKLLVKKHFDVDMTTYEEVIETAPKKKGVDRDYDFGRVSLDQALEYAADDAYYTLLLYDHFRAAMTLQKLIPAYENIERPFARTLKNVEHYGVAVDLDAIAYADKRLPEILEQVDTSIYKAAGEVFNISSGAQLGKILFDKLGIGKNVPTTKNGQYRTNEKTLSKYATKHKIVADVLRRKKIQKSHSSFVEGTKGFIAKDSKIHPSFNGSGTATGRLSCSKPNLQQVTGGEIEEVSLRNFFIPSEGHRFVVADYSQVELRVMAHFSKDKYMINAFLAGEDFHDAMARTIYKVPTDQKVDKKQRTHIKAINFGVGYGRGPGSIAETLGISFEDAQELINDWFKQFAGVKAHTNHVIKQARQHGYVRTLSGKKRIIYHLTSSSFAIRRHAERQAYSTKIQGSAADIIKLAMIALEPKLEMYDAKMNIQIHDELVVDCPESACEEVKILMKETMENPLNGKNPLRLPLVVEPNIVDKWGDAK